MSSIRNSRSRLVTTAAAVVLAALSLTACDDGTGVTDEGASANTAATGTAATPGASSAGSDASKDSGSGSGSSAKGSSSSDGSSSGDAEDSSDAAEPGADAPAQKAQEPSGKVVTCEGSTTRTVAAPLTRPVNHMLLTVTNTGRNTCFLYGYPAVRFGEAQSVPPVIEDSQPQAVVKLAPGQSGYAAVSLSATDGSASNGRTEKSLEVYFQGRSGSESVGSGATPSLPAKGVYVDDSLKVTYWQQTMDTAIDW
ncbi:DUF4232 domain-containing protein [Streptomyces sp. NPDC059142]|uniref:DUF4232 domain-containing protein n=1 Tax=Streptomyces sp. NPDC059142 TaxID=3346739 RepID=UPI0036873A57